MTHYSPAAISSPGVPGVWAYAPCGAMAGLSEPGVHVTSIVADVTCERCLSRLTRRARSVDHEVIHLSPREVFGSARYQLGIDDTKSGDSE